MGNFKNDGLTVAEYVLDVATDGGTGVVDLSAKAGKEPIPVGAVIEGVTMYVHTAFAGGTDLAWGNGDDADGYSGAAIVTASLTAGAAFNGMDNAAALIWDDTNDHAISLPVADAADGKVEVTMTGTHTAGKCSIMVKYLYPQG